VQLITARNNYETAKAQLNQAVGLREGTDYDVGDEIIPPVEDEEQPLETLVAKALAARPEMATLAKQREAQEATISATKGAYGPTLSALGSVAEEGTALNGLQPFWSVGVLLSWPIFQGGLTNGQVRSAEAALANIHGQEGLEDLQVRFGVDSAQLAVRAAKATIGAAQDAVTNAHEQLRLAEQRYATGVGSIIELDDAQVAYTTAAAQLVQARYSLATARAQLLAALGRT
jgi:outer membrane protein